ncbi:uncharacterized protein LOC133178919 [Saccostrea echinata]|uniref:uncharacterized protein LOC133178919 n=1 Tax=Saccostrea echinata TaxID=191078 RepID=UPI002A8209C0|nr:uncharacterized protein LOC133178919 [Saccostrea echinata]
MALKYTVICLLLLMTTHDDQNGFVLASKSCDCACNSAGITYDDLDPVTQEKVNNITKELKVDTRNTSSHTRTLISASDPRPSAQAAGFIGIVILSIVFGSLVLLDLTRLCFKSEIKYID